MQKTIIIARCLYSHPCTVHVFCQVSLPPNPRPPFSSHFKTTRCFCLYFSIYGRHLFDIALLGKNYRIQFLWWVIVLYRGGSRIPLRGWGGGWTLTHDFAKISQNLHEIENILGRGASLDCHWFMYCKMDLGIIETTVRNQLPILKGRRVQGV